MKVVFDQKAIDDLEAIHDWIFASSPSAAEKIIQQLVSRIENLASFPSRGRPRRRVHERELIVPGLPYVVVYEITEAIDVVLIRAIFHGAQDRTHSD